MASTKTENYQIVEVVSEDERVIYHPETNAENVLVSANGIESDNLKGALEELASKPSGGTSEGAVSSVNGKMGEVVLSKEDVGLGQVDNTSDEEKPISKAVQTALDKKANAEDLDAKADIAALADKADKSDLEDKVTQDALDAAVSPKADKSYVEGELAKKANTEDLGELASKDALTAEDVGLGKLTNDAQVKRSEMGEPNGVATLDETGKVHGAQLPESVVALQQKVATIEEKDGTQDAAIEKAQKEATAAKDAVATATAKLGELEEQIQGGLGGASDPVIIDMYMVEEDPGMMISIEDLNRAIEAMDAGKCVIVRMAMEDFDGEEGASVKYLMASNTGISEDSPSDGSLRGLFLQMGPSSITFMSSDGQTVTAEVSELATRENIGYEVRNELGNKLSEYLRRDELGGQLSGYLLKSELEGELTDYAKKGELTSNDVGLENLTNDAQVKRTEMGEANGVATLDETGRVPDAQLPESVIALQQKIATLEEKDGSQDTEIEKAQNDATAAKESITGIQEAYEKHETDKDVHVSAEERVRWNAAYDGYFTTEYGIRFPLSASDPVGERVKRQGGEIQKWDIEYTPNVGSVTENPFEAIKLFNPDLFVDSAGNVFRSFRRFYTYMERTDEYLYYWVCEKQASPKYNLPRAFYNGNSPYWNYVDIGAYEGGRDSLTGYLCSKKVSTPVANLTMDEAVNKAQQWHSNLSVNTLDEMYMITQLSEITEILQPLILIMFGTRNSQKIYRGIVDRNLAVLNPVGETDSIPALCGTASNDGKASFKVMGIENIWGHINKFIVDLAIKGGALWVCEQTGSWTTTENPDSDYRYKKATLSVPISSSSTIRDIGQAPDHSDVILPTAIGASSNAYYTDVITKSGTGTYIASFGGSCVSSHGGGLFCLDLATPLDISDVEHGARLSHRRV